MTLFFSPNRLFFYQLFLFFFFFFFQQFSRALGVAGNIWRSYVTGFSRSVILPRPSLADALLFVSRFFAFSFLLEGKKGWYVHSEIRFIPFIHSLLLSFLFSPAFMLFFLTVYFRLFLSCFFFFGISQVPGTLLLTSTVFNLPFFCCPFILRHEPVPGMSFFTV